LRTAAIVPLAEADAKSTESFLLKYDFLRHAKPQVYQLNRSDGGLAGWIEIGAAAINAG
jgi:hypothetical protein